MVRRKNKSGFRVVLDTNVIVAANISQHDKSPNRELIDRWLKDEFAFLYSEDIQAEYTEKLLEKAVADEIILRFLSNLEKFGSFVVIRYYYLPKYPVDSDDVCFLLCAHNGKASHLVTYDRHLLDLPKKFRFKITLPTGFLKDLRFKLTAMN